MPSRSAEIGCVGQVDETIHDAGLPDQLCLAWRCDRSWWICWPCRPSFRLRSWNALMRSSNRTNKLMLKRTLREIQEVRRTSWSCSCSNSEGRGLWWIVVIRVTWSEAALVSMAEEVSEDSTIAHSSPDHCPGPDASGPSWLWQDHAGAGWKIFEYICVNIQVLISYQQDFPQPSPIPAPRIRQPPKRPRVYSGLSPRWVNQQVVFHFIVVILLIHLINGLITSLIIN